MNCAACGYEAPEGFAFCNGCGAKLELTCAACGAKPPLPQYMTAGAAGMSKPATAQPHDAGSTPVYS
jgi:hypothetical protein